ncbi:MULTISPECIES: response regulator transcription factor [Bacillota]|jgi:DNA-binding response OmpR family regulator|uniref:Response regulator transcription factor n=2 Tax=Amedibacillus TaxID=2749846 RepID=A0A7G9GRY5_9FIRM|nr:MULTISPECIES: response regulator transcription factor [Bacillota]QNM13567.1 response regulator transcription factor [[Eubacterium] hominis]MCH4286391.1 response regulator transcription factor [Amedibacillus hominis]RGB51769.1 DNA-binding response regulator [Absiella sp. AM22-9]RGB57298.1 DNA-binding response regulator [Absiella sp. AM10-20]RHU06260.1 DNA-binding response regulator [Absiella sp. AM27-20]
MHLLIIEDHNDINAMIQDYLQKQGFQCDQAYSGTEGRLYYSTNDYDLIILDLMLPGLSGEELLEDIRKHSNVPVIVLSAKDSLDSKVNVLGAGADDYLCKPFELEELLARIQVQLRKSNKTSINTALQYKKLLLDSEQYDAKINDTYLNLTKHEYLILELLIRNPKRVFTKEEIYEYAWNDTYYGDDKTINTHMSNIRKKIRTQVAEEYIKTVWGIGFKMAE